MHHLLHMANECQHREHCLYQHPVLPLSPWTQFEVGGIAFCGMEGGITQDNHPFFKLSNEPLKGIVCDIGGVTCPRDHQPPLIEEQTQFAPDDPAVIGEAFAADLLGTAAFAHGVDQLNAIRVDDTEDRGSPQEGPCPVLMGREEAKEPRPLGEAGKQRTIVPGQPQNIVYAGAELT